MSVLAGVMLASTGVASSDIVENNSFIKNRIFKHNVLKCLNEVKQHDYLNYIIPIFNQKKIPYEFVYLPVIESCFDPAAVSNKGAIGMWQINDITAKHLNLDTGIVIDDRYNWKKSTHAAAEYLLFLKERFDTWTHVLAAYNVGPTYLRDQIEKHNTTQLNKLQLPKETVDYVHKFVAMIYILRNDSRKTL